MKGENAYAGPLGIIAAGSDNEHFFIIISIGLLPVASTDR
jgi:hypothetical protein